MNYSVVLPCGGQGKRMGLSYNKLFCYVQDEMVIEKTVHAFEQDEQCQQIIIVHSLEDEERLRKLCTSNKCVFVRGGNERYESVYNGLQLVKSEWVLVHDGARPFITQEVIDRVLEHLKEHPAVICGVPVKDTIKRVVNGEIVDTPIRSELWQAQTPQGFKTSLLMECYQRAMDEQVLITDDASAVERYGNIRVHMVNGDYGNKKITTIEDLK